LSKKIHSSIVYAFYVGIWSIFNLCLLVFDPWMPSLRELLLDLLAGGLFLVTLIFWYKALHQSEATRTVPLVGALTPIFSFALSFMFLDEIFTNRQFFVFFVLIAGGVLISVKNTKIYFLNRVINRFKEIYGNVFGTVHAEFRPTRRLIVNSVTSAFFFAAYYVLMKYIYMNQPFIGSFVWSRMGSFLGVVVIWLIPYYRKMISEHKAETRSPKNFAFFILVRLLAAVAFIILNYAISLGNVAMVNALQGIQFAFLILIVLLMSVRFPKILKEEMGRGVLVQKIAGVCLVSIGLYFLMVG
jgi:drug/metabolite transporter (DMT)-like permease